MLTKRVCILTTAFCFLTLAPTASTFAEDDGDVDEGGERCIDTRRISSMKIVDKQNILFYMRGQTIYHKSKRRFSNNHGLISHRNLLGNWRTI